MTRLLPSVLDSILLLPRLMERELALHPLVELRQFLVRKCASKATHPESCPGVLEKGLLQYQGINSVETQPTAM